MLKISEAAAHFERAANGPLNADADDLALALRGESESSGGVFGLSMAYPADVSRYARTESAVFDLHGVLSRGTPAAQRSVSSVDEGIGREPEIACLNLPYTF